MFKTLVSSVVLAAAFSASAHAYPLPVEAGSPILIKGDREACSVQSFLPQCEGRQDVSANPLRLEEVEAIQAKLFGRFIYSLKKHDAWRSSADRVEAGDKWIDDCAGLTFTVLDMLAKAGHPTDKMWRAIVIPDTRSMSAKAPAVLHMVGLVEVDGVVYVVGDRNDERVYRLTQANFVPTHVSSVGTDGIKWAKAIRIAPGVRTAQLSR